MKRWSMFFVVCLFMPATLWAQQVVRTYPVTLQLDVNAQGQVAAAKVMGPVLLTNSRGAISRHRHGALPKVLSKAAVKVASEWRFSVPRVAGKAVAGRTFARAVLQLVKQGNGTYRVDLEYRHNGPFVNVRPVPRYPRRMSSARRNAGMVADAVVEPDGSISKIRIVKVFTNASDHGRAFAKAGKEAIQRWKGKPMRIAGHVLPTHVRIPLFFAMSDQDMADKARQKQQVMDLLRTGTTPHLDADSIKPGEVLAVDSPFTKQPSS